MGQCEPKSNKTWDYRGTGVRRQKVARSALAPLTKPPVVRPLGMNQRSHGLRAADWSAIAWLAKPRSPEQMPQGVVLRWLASNRPHAVDLAGACIATDCAKLWDRPDKRRLGPSRYQELEDGLGELTERLPIAHAVVRLTERPDLLGPYNPAAEAIDDDDSPVSFVLSTVDQAQRVWLDTSNSLNAGAAILAP